jgi:hypothetical protein
MTEHNGLPVAGYQPQTDERISLVNANKTLEEMCLRNLDVLRNLAGIDQSWLADGRRDLEKAWMAINRAIFRPSRVRLDGDP